MPESLGDLKRSHLCGDLRASHIGGEVVLAGWVHTRRDHGGVIFIDLRDHTGIVQVVFNPATDADTHARAGAIRTEFVLAVIGTVRARPEGTVNPDLVTGEVEILVKRLVVLNEAKSPPFPIADPVEADESTRLRYRYLDLRRPAMQVNLRLRHRLSRAVREYLDAKSFVDIETPMLTRSTPEGARDYLVPSRIEPGKFYALPQSPQLFKQLLMISGFDRYYQIVKCFRDEDLRRDRQPEFTQIDIEMAFITPGSIYEVIDGLIAHVFRETIGHEVATPIARISFREAIDRYGVDVPDLRFGLEHRTLTDLVRSSGFKVFSQAASSGGIVKAICVPREDQPGGGFSRKGLDDLVDRARELGAAGLSWVRVEESGWKSPIAKYFKAEEIVKINEAVGARAGDTVLFIADRPTVAHDVLGTIRLDLGRRLGRMKPGEFALTWVNEFPLVQYDPESGRHHAVHHPFTAPLDSDLDRLESEPLTVRAAAYDIVLNGMEIGGGSIRNHRLDVQSKVFKTIGITAKDARERFGFLLEALEHGAPPHGGIALGMDRIAMVLAGGQSIRDVIAFPKTQKASDLLTSAPAEVDEVQLEELGIRVVRPRGGAAGPGAKRKGGEK